jgi:hypothetical protein
MHVRSQSARGGTSAGLKGLAPGNSDARRLKTHNQRSRSRWIVRRPVSRGRSDSSRLSYRFRACFQAFPKNWNATQSLVRLGTAPLFLETEAGAKPPENTTLWQRNCLLASEEMHALASLCAGNFTTPFPERACPQVYAYRNESATGVTPVRQRSSLLLRPLFLQPAVRVRAAVAEDEPRCP